MITTFVILWSIIGFLWFVNADYLEDIDDDATFAMISALIIGGPIVIFLWIYFMVDDFLFDRKHSNE